MLVIVSKESVVIDIAEKELALHNIVIYLIMKDHKKEFHSQQRMPPSQKK